jgi:hypothetical protein
MAPDAGRVGLPFCVFSEMAGYAFYLCRDQTVWVSTVELVLCQKCGLQIFPTSL